MNNQEESDVIVFPPAEHIDPANVLTGIFSGYHNDDYHKTLHLGSSGVRQLIKSPNHYRQMMVEEKKSTSDMIKGTLTHMAILEEVEFFRAIEFDYAIKPEGLSLSTKEGKAWKKEAEDKGQTIITDQDYVDIYQMQKSVKSHPQIAKIFTFPGEAEVSYYAVDPDYNLPVKARPDFTQVLDGETVVYELKTTSKPIYPPDMFSRLIYFNGYHIQAVWYRHVMELCGVNIDGFEFYFIAVESVSPYNSCLYRLSPDAMDMGWKDCEKALKSYRAYLNGISAQKNFGGYPFSPDKIEEIDLPGWVYKKEYYE